MGESFSKPWPSPHAERRTLVERQTYYCYDNFGNVVSCNNAWYDWGRWVALAGVILGFIVIFFLFSLLSARRRRRRGMTPYYGTGWAGRTPMGHGAAQYNPQYQQQPWQEQPTYGNQQGGQAGGYYGYGHQPPPPQYDPQNRGYFGSEPVSTNNTGVYEMQPPNRAYQAPEVSGAKK